MRQHRKLTAVIVLAVLVACGFIGTRVFSEPTARIIYLKPDQEAAVKKVDAMILGVQKQFESLQQQRGALITGFAISTDDVQKAGLEWERDYDFIADKEGHGFKALTEAEKKAKAEAAQGK